MRSATPVDRDPLLTDGDEMVSLARSDVTNVGLMVRHAFRAFQRRLQELVLPFGVSSAEFRVMRALDTGGSLTQRQIAGLAGMDRPYAALIAKQLREKRLVEARADSQDGRRVLLSLTGEGARITGAIADQLEEVNRAAIADIASNNLATFVKVIERVQLNLERSKG